jgi:two-component system, cell cycle response regulator DivK
MSSLAKKVLIIDDDSRNIFALKAILKSKGYNCMSSADAIEGLNIIKQQDDIGIVLLDMMMPEMDGYEALSHIRQDEKTMKMPVIAVTAQAMVGDREKCLDAGADDYISKPIDVDALTALLDKFVK